MGLTGELTSFSESWGEINRAVGRGPVVEGPRVFFKIGCGVTAGAFDAIDDDVVLGLLLFEWWKLMALEAPGP